jgi:hypothetical protein
MPAVETDGCDLRAQCCSRLTALNRGNGSTHDNFCAIRLTTTRSGATLPPGRKRATGIAPDDVEQVRVRVTGRYGISKNQPIYQCSFSANSNS